MKKHYINYPLTILITLIIYAQSIFAGPPPSILGQSAVLIDRATGSILYEKNANTRMYPASTTKILTSVLCLENLDLSASMTKTSRSVQSVPSDSSHIGLRIGDTFPIIDGIHAVMLGSDNYVSYDLASLLDGSAENFANRMNLKAKQIGANNSHFVNPHGYHDPNHYTTAYDLALIMDYAFKNSIFSSIVKSPAYTLNRLNDLSHPIDFSNTVKLVDPGSPFYRPYNLGGKTGFTRAAGRSLVAVANQDGMELIGVVLKSENPTFFEDMNALFDYGFENFQIKYKDSRPYLENNSFSPWAKEIVSFALDKGLIETSSQNYQSPISKQDFISLLMQTIFLGQHHSLEGFSKDLAIQEALDRGLIQNTSLLSGFTGPLSRQDAANLTSKLLSSINYRPAKIYPIHPYADQDLISKDHIDSIYSLQQCGIMGSYKGGFIYPSAKLTLEEGLSITTQLYKLYSNSPFSYIDQIRKSLLQPNNQVSLQ